MSKTKWVNLENTNCLQIYYPNLGDEGEEQTYSDSAMQGRRNSTHKERCLSFPFDLGHALSSGSEKPYLSERDSRQAWFFMILRLDLQGYPDHQWLVHPLAPHRCRVRWLLRQ